MCDTPMDEVIADVIGAVVEWVLWACQVLRIDQYE